MIEGSKPGPAQDRHIPCRENDRGDVALGPTLRLWVPEAMRGNKHLYLKYGVTVPGGRREETLEMDGLLYERAYLEKLRQLIDRETLTPLAVILDRVFTAPHLASGDTNAIAQRLFSEIHEVRHPVELMKAWLQTGDNAHLEALIHPVTMDQLTAPPAEDALIHAEMTALGLEDFLNLL
jgi:hypothetical protein